MGLIEDKITNNIYLTAINSYDELSIWCSIDESSVRYLLVPETVFAVGYNDDFIIAKSHPKNSGEEINKNLTYYHIIEIDKLSQQNPEQSISLLKEQFEYKRKEFNIPADLDFTIMYSELE